GDRIQQEVHQGGFGSAALLKEGVQFLFHEGFHGFKTREHVELFDALEMVDLKPLSQEMLQLLLKLRAGHDLADGLGNPSGIEPISEGFLPQPCGGGTVQKAERQKLCDLI